MLESRSINDAPALSVSTLGDVEVGSRVRVKELRAEPVVCQRLREMGFCEFAEVCKVLEGGAIICWICDGKVALSKRLAKNIVVEHVSFSSHPK